jgi:hypothetical protein
MILDILDNKVRCVFDCHERNGMGFLSCHSVIYSAPLNLCTHGIQYKMYITCTCTMDIIKMVPYMLGDRSKCHPEKTMFFEDDIFLAGKPTRSQIEWVSQVKKTTRVIFPLKKHTRSAVFCLSHDTKWEHFEAFWARIVANWIQNQLLLYHTVGLHAWQRQKLGWNVRIKLFSQVWNRFQWCSTERSPNYLGF